MNYLGLVPSKDEIVSVLLQQEGDAFTVVSDETIRIASGPEGYRAAYLRVRDLIVSGGVTEVVLKQSTVGRFTKLAHLLAAEVRGFLIVAAVEAGANVHLASKSSLSKSFGDRSADEYVNDNEFWEAELTGQLRKGSREAALMILHNAQG